MFVKKHYRVNHQNPTNLVNEVLDLTNQRNKSDDFSEAKKERTRRVDEMNYFENCQENQFPTKTQI